MKRAKLKITLEAVSDLFKLSGLDIWVTGGKTLEDGSGSMEFTLSGSGLPDECEGNSDKTIMVALYSDVIEFDGTEVGAKITRADNIDLSGGAIVIHRRNMEIYKVVD